MDEARVEAIRKFNRFYTRRIGVLHEGLLESPYSLAEVRVSAVRRGTVTDRAVITVCDTRLVTMRYGRDILAGLPPFRITKSKAPPASGEPARAVDPGRAIIG